MRNGFIERIKYNIDLDLRKRKRIIDILPIEMAGVNLTNKENGNEIIEQIVEEPLRKACKALRNKGIETLMSSANKYNLVKKGQKPLEKEDVKTTEWSMYHTELFDKAGKGYAWIMINYNTLSDENKKILFEMEEEKNDKGENIGEKMIWFVKAINGDKIAEKNEMLDAKFKKSSFFLIYNSDIYPKKSVFLRMPINDKTTVIDVEKYFEKLTERLKQQQREIIKEEKDRAD